MSYKTDIGLLQKENKELKQELDEIIKLSRERFELAMHATNDGLFDWDIITNEIYYSPGWKRMLGYADDELPNEYSVGAKLTHPDDVELALKRLSEYIEGKLDKLEMEFRMKHKLGHWITVLSRANTIKNEHGQVVRLIGTNIDITARKEAEEALRLSEKRLVESQRVAHIGYYNLDIETGCWTNSEELNRIFGIGDDYDRTVIGWTKLMHPEDADAMLEYLLKKVIEEKTDFNKEYRIINQLTGETRWVYGNGELKLNPNGEAIEMFGTIQDVTERKNMEVALRSSEENHRLLFENAGVGIGQYALDGTILSLNPKALSYLSVKLEDVVGINIREVFGEAGNEYFDRIKNAVVSERAATFEDLVVIQGAKNWFRSTYNLIRDSKGAVIGVMIISDDITEKKKVEEAFQIEQKRASNILKGTGAGTWEWNVITGELVLNERWAQILGYTLVELAPININTWEKTVHPDDRASTLAKVQKHFSDGTEYIAEFRQQHKDGHWVWISARGSVIEWTSKGEPLKMYGTHLDITQSKMAEEELQRSQQRFDLSLRGANLGLWDWNVQTGEVIFNERWADIIGYELSDLQPVSLATWSENTHPDDLELSNKLLQAHFKGKTNIYECEARMKHKNGHWVWVLDRGKVFEWTPNGKPLRMSGTHLDITDRKLAEQALRTSEEKYRLLFRNMTSGFALHEMLFDKDGEPVDYRFIELNPAFEKLTGFQRSEILKKTVREVMPETEEYWIKKYGHVVKTGEPLEYENYSKELNRIYNVFAYRSAPNQFAVMVNDVTEQRTIQHEIEENERQLQLIFDSSPAIMLLLNNSTEIIKVNQTGLQYAGATLDRVMKEQAGDVFRCIYALNSKKGCGTTKACEQCKLRNAVTETITTGIPQKKVETELQVNVNGYTRTLYFMLSVTPAGEFPEPTYLVSLDDITKQKKTENELEISYTKYKTLADHTYDWEYWKGPDHNYIYSSPSCKRISGYSSKEFLENKDLFRSLIHPDDFDKWLEHEAKAASKIFCKNPVELRIITKDKKQRWINHVCQPVYDEKGQFLGNRGTNRDITVQKLSQLALTRSDMRFKQLSELAFEGILIHKSGIVTDVNMAAEKLLGYSKDELLGLDGIKLCVVEKYHALLQDVIRMDSSQPFEIEMIRKDGTILIAEMISRYISKEDRIWVAVIRDITEQKQHQQQILSAIINTEEQERKRIAQELHDGLGPVLSTIKLYTQTYLSSDNENFKQKIEGQLLSGIDEALTQVSSISNNLSPHVLSDFGLQIAIQKFIDKLGKVTKLNFSFTYNITSIIEKDIEITLYRVTIELINNTRKHARAKNISIKITEHNDVLWLAYTDDGIGFNFGDKLKDKLGMGLFNIVNRIKSIGGDVHFSQPGYAGVMCQIELPLATRS